MSQSTEQRSTSLIYKAARDVGYFGSETSRGAEELSFLETLANIASSLGIPIQRVVDAIVLGIKFGQSISRRKN